MTMPYPAYGARPNNEAYPPTFSSNSSTYKPGALDNDDLGRGMSRTPSPTPSEAKALNEPLFSMKQLLNWRFWVRKEWTLYYIVISIILVLTALISIYHHQIVKALTPVTNWMHGLKYGYLIPIGVLFVISFPPLFGHEIVAILCGVVWGLWIGFAIVCAGTFIGEVGNFYAFKMCCRARGEKMERTQLSYACLARCVRTGGFKIALIARFSAIPGHFTTAVFSTCGMNIFVFSIAAILSLPKQFVTVYLGVILDQSDDGTASTKSKLISDGVLAATFLVTLLAMWYIFHQMALAKPLVIYERRKARQGKVQGVDLGMYAAGPNDSESSISYAGDGVDIPLTAKPNPNMHHPRYDYEQQQKQRQAAEWAAQRRQYDAAQRGVPYDSAQRGPYDAQRGPAQPYSQQYEAGVPYSPHGEGHQQWDAQGRAVGYTPGPGGAVVYAPQPQPAQSGGRTPIQANSVYNSSSNAYVAHAGAHTPGQAEVYAHGRAPAQAHVVREGTGDEVGWDMGPPQQRQGQQTEMRQTNPVRQHTLPTQALPAHAQAQTIPAHAQQAQGDPGTPTQAQYAAYAEPPTATLAYLRSPFADPEGHAQHAAEPTDASYHTAYGSEDEQQQRAYSPTPPSYRTNAR
ncbi:hypothetical protein B0H12DRAFT_1047381 [Mycena haematopus]|nr:hypothetical protein B0H12DRAFT_1047381 [Mycena haematopus]